MSLLAPRMLGADPERASVVLPTVKCSSCNQSIPLNYLGEHTCAPLPVPSAGSSQQPASPFFPSTSPVLPSSPSLNRPGAPTTLGNRPGFGYPIGQVVPSRFGGDYPADVPHSAVSDASTGRWPAHDAPSSRMPHAESITVQLPDTTSGGGAGMAGVGRRAFAAAAAWNGAGHEQRPSLSIPDSPHQRTSPNLPPTNGVFCSSPLAGPSTLRHTPSPNAGMRPSPQRSPSGGGGREPVIMPKAPLSNRPLPQRKQSLDESYALTSPELRSASALSGRSPGDMRGGTSPIYDRGPSPFDQRQRSPVEQKRSPEWPTVEPKRSPVERTEPSPFIDKYRQLMGSKSDQSHLYSNRAPIDDQDDTHSLDSAEEPSALPWATPISPDLASKHTDRFEHQRYPTDGSIGSTTSSSASCGPSMDHRGGGSSGHENELVMTPSQSWEGLVDRITNVAIDSQGKPPPAYGEATGLGINDVNLPNNNNLEQIGEEEEDDDHDRFHLSNRRASTARRVPRSSSQSTVTLGSSPPSGTVAAAHSAPSGATHARTRSKTIGDAARPKGPSPEMPPVPLSTSPTASSRPKRACARCDAPVGGVRRFVERDGVILCEADWKKMYLPACRRCRQPIEKSAVSSSDGQLKGKWHRACFTCTRCDKPFDGEEFYVHDGRPWCQYHYAEENGTLCAAAACRKPIEGPCILAPAAHAEAHDQRFHPGHLRCDHRGGVSGAQTCRESMAEYYDVAGGRYCERHASEALRRAAAGAVNVRSEKRRTRLVDLPRGSLIGP
ncbi:hypothetical protein Q8F55_002020 [Vanrija albida]|uniref:LIM zinc-binding domain-containing protein n=1 Tax=Vanrija albida TaxID=181172 RepID=A0ABR3Q8R8_9TREE